MYLYCAIVLPKHPSCSHLLLLHLHENTSLIWPALAASCTFGQALQKYAGFPFILSSFCSIVDYPSPYAELQLDTLSTVLFGANIRVS